MLLEEVLFRLTTPMVRTISCSSDELDTTFSGLVISNQTIYHDRIVNAVGGVGMFSGLLLLWCYVPELHY